MLDGSSPQLETSNGLQYAEAAAAIRIRSFDVGVSNLRFTQLRRIYSLEDVNNKDHSPECRWRAEREVGWGELEMNFNTHLNLAGLEGWASSLGPGKKQACNGKVILRLVETTEERIEAGTIQVGLEQEHVVNLGSAFTDSQGVSLNGTLV